MDSYKKKESNFDSFLYGQEEELNLYQGIMNQNIGRRKLILSSEIRKKQKLLNKFIKERFGKNFFPIKLESIKLFESNLKTYLFSPQSEFLNNFPKLKRKLNKERKIKEEKLKEKINIGSLLYLSLSGKNNITNKHTNMNEKLFKISRNLSSTMSKDVLSDAIYKVKYKDKNRERINKILSYKNKRNEIHKNTEKLLKTDNNFYQNFKNEEKNTIYEEEKNTNQLPHINVDFKKILRTDKNINKAKFIFRNKTSSLKKYKGLTTTSNQDNLDNSIKSFSPFSTFTYNNHKSSNNFFKISKIFQKDFNEFVENLDEKTKSCNRKLISLINGNRKKNLKKKEQHNKELINLKSIIIDKKHKKPIKKINNINQIKSLIKQAKIDFEGEATIEKLRKKELKNFGHYINIMSDDLVLDKVNELFSKEEIKLNGKNFSRNEIERLRKKRQKELIVFNSRKKTKENYNTMLRLENDLTSIKDKFNKTNRKALLKTNKS